MSTPGEVLDGFLRLPATMRTVSAQLSDIAHRMTALEARVTTLTETVRAALERPPA